jgi:NAD(P)-dependent dehydrogenase (short-subunit alcohol dehydrogenase family)
MPMQGLLDGKRVVVTGASRGLGRSFATAMAAQGASLVINGTQPDRLAETAALVAALGGPCEQVLGSVAEVDVCQAIVARAVEAYGGVDVLVNNAGIVRDRTLLKMTPEEFDDVIAVNLRGTWACGRAAADAMREGGGTIINVVSNSGLTGAIGQTNYAAAKAGVVGMTLSWTRELARYGIRVNAVWPVAVTDMTQVVIDNVERRAREAGREVPTPQDMGLGDPDEVANVVVYLASDKASAVNGQIVTFNGRKMALWALPREVNVEVRDGWTLDDVVEQFPLTVGAELQPLYDALGG